MSYESFASVYDRLMSDCDYSARAEYLLGLFDTYGKHPELMLDVACGTGSVSVEMLSRGIDVIAVDVSPEMLTQAEKKAELAGHKLLCLCQDACELDLFGTVDSAVCCLDSLNHITDYNALCTVFERISLFLEPNALFIFDVNTPYKHENVLADNVFVIDDDEVYCVWQNDTNMPITNIMLDFFIRDGELYKRSCEEFSERAYSDEELLKAADNAGLDLVEIFEDMTRCAPKEDCERKIFIMRKR